MRKVIVETVFTRQPYHVGTEDYGSQTEAYRALDETLRALVRQGWTIEHRTHGPGLAEHERERVSLVKGSEALILTVRVSY